MYPTNDNTNTNINTMDNNNNTFAANYDWQFVDCRPSNPPSSSSSSSFSTSSSTSPHMAHSAYSQTPYIVSASPTLSTPSPIPQPFMSTSVNAAYQRDYAVLPPPPPPPPPPAVVPTASDLQENLLLLPYDVPTAPFTYGTGSEVEMPAMTSEGVYSYMVELKERNPQEFANLLSAINSIGLPTQFCALPDSSSSSSPPPEVITSSTTEMTSPAETHPRCGHVFTSKKVSNPSSAATAARSMIAKKFFAGRDEGEYYYCVDCGEQRKANTFATEGHCCRMDGKLRVRWKCPMCNKSTAVTYRTAHLTGRHGIKKAGNGSKK